MRQTHKYTNGDIVIIWQPNLCQHTGICVRGLQPVFDPRRRPWIEPLAAPTDKIIEQIKLCPSGALSFVAHQADEKND